MLTSLKLKNFKAWRDSNDIALAPVTLLLGSNSTGKSSLIQSLLLLKQTVTSPDRSIHLNLGGDEVNDYFNFGHFNDVLTQGASPRQFEISFEFGLPLMRRRTTEISRQGKFSATYAMNSSGAAITQECFLEGKNRSFRAVRRDKGAYSIYVGDEGQPREKSRSFAPERSIALPSEAIQLLGLDGGFAQDISLTIRRELENIAYLGPLRRKPERDYVWNKTRPGDLGVDGFGSINALFSSAFIKGKDASEDIIAGVSKYLARMGVAERLEVRQLGHSTRYEIVVHRDGVEANLRDVGIGILRVNTIIEGGSDLLIEGSLLTLT